MSATFDKFLGLVRDAKTSADAIADALETAPAADLARIQSSVSGYVRDALSFASAAPTLSGSNRAVYLRDADGLYEQSGDGGTVAAGAGSNKAWYAQVAIGAPVTLLGAEFSFIAGSGGKNGSIAAIPWATSLETPGVPDTSLHLAVTRWAWNIGSFSAGVFTPIQAGALALPLAAATKYRMEVVAMADRVVLLLPGGQTEIINVAARANLGAFACIESYQFDGAADDRAVVHSAWFSTGAQQDSAAYITKGLGVGAYAQVANLGNVTLPANTETLIPGLSLTMPAGQNAVTASVFVSGNASGLIAILNYTNLATGSVESRNYMWLAGTAQGGICQCVEAYTANAPMAVTLQLNPLGTAGTIEVEASRTLSLRSNPL